MARAFDLVGIGNAVGSIKGDVKKKHFSLIPRKGFFLTSRRVARAFDLVGIGNAVGAPLLRSLQGRESGMHASRAFDSATINKSRGTRSIAG